MTRPHAAVVLASVVAVGAACRGAPTLVTAPDPAPAVGCDSGACADPANQVAITYLGVAGFLVQYRGATILTAPSFTNPSFWSVMPSAVPLLRRLAPRIRADTALVDSLLPAAADEASAILVGHGHYDHLLDVPYVAARRATNATVYGSPSVRYTLMGDSALRAAAARRLVAIPPESAGSDRRPGRWYYTPDSAVRFMAIAADHAPTLSFLRLHFLFGAGAVANALESLPAKAADWKLGEPYAYLIDALAPGDTTPALRIYFQDAPAKPRLGFPPAGATGQIVGRPVDVALLCAATARNVPHTPDSLLKALRPRVVVVDHWESFFRPQTRPLHENPAAHVRSFSVQVRKILGPSATVVVPAPRQTVRIAVTPRAAPREPPDSTGSAEH